MSIPQPAQERLAMLTSWAGGKLSRKQLLSRWPDEPGEDWAVAWTKAAQMRMVPPHPQAVEGLRLALTDAATTPARRPTPEVARRAILGALCAESADAITGADGGRHLRVFEHPLFDTNEPRHFEHAELHLLASVAKGEAVAPAVSTQLSWGDHSAGTLAWALGWHDLDPMQDLGLATLVRMLPRSQAELADRTALARPRPIDDIHAALSTARAQLDPSGAPSLRHSMALERVKALRWLTEPWWPELALTPWRSSGTGWEGVGTEADFEERVRTERDRLRLDGSW